MNPSICQIPTLSCPMLGAYRGAAGIKDGAIVVHSIPGCLFGAARPHIQSHWYNMPHLSTVVYDNEVIMGGEQRLRETVHWAIDNFQPSILFVVTGCIPEIIGDDISAVIAEFNNCKVPVEAISTPGFKDDEVKGLLELMHRLVNHMQVGEKRPKSVNLIGLCADDFQIDNDLKELRSMLAPEISINTVLCYDSYENIQNVPRAEHNIVFPGFETIGELIQEKFCIPYKVFEYPYGMEASSAFIRQSHALFGLESEATVVKHEEALLQRLSAISNYIDNLSNVPCAVIGNRLFGGALSHALSTELGMKAMFYDTSLNRDFYEIEKQIEISPACMIFGDSFSRGIAEKLKIPHVSCFYPVLDRMACSPRTYVGYTGLTYLLEDIVNMAMGFREEQFP